MKIMNIGILAHVDAGKTTLTESILYASGTITESGRVDRGSTITDSMALEKQRGITIQASIASYQWGHVKVNLIDTPGHIDFYSEVERSLNVLDGAILLISAKDGIQAQTRILFDAIRKRKLPALIFINKIDQPDIDLDSLYEDIRAKLSSHILIMQSITNRLLVGTIILLVGTIISGFLRFLVVIRPLPRITTVFAPRTTDSIRIFRQRRHREV